MDDREVEDGVVRCCGRVDLPGGDWPTLLGSIESLMAEFPDDTTVYPGHMGTTTLGRERAINPFLRALALQGRSRQACTPGCALLPGQALSGDTCAARPVPRAR